MEFHGVHAIPCGSVWNTRGRVKTSKYVHCIHHHYNNNNHPIMQLAVVECIDGAADALVEEQIELPPEDLCQGFEIKQEKI